jgi:hypothetical protein
MIVRFIETWQEKYDELPEDIRACLSPQIVDIYREGSAYFRKSAKVTKYPPLRRLLKKLAEQPVSLVLLGEREPQYEAWFRFSYPENGCLTLVQPPEDQPLPGDPPPIVREVYSRLGALRMFDMTSVYYGLLPHRSIRAFSATRYWLSDENSIRPDNCFAIISLGDGDYEGYRGEWEGFLYDHERGVIEDYYIESSVERELTSFVERAE